MIDIKYKISINQYQYLRSNILILMEMCQMPKCNLTDKLYILLYGDFYGISKEEIKKNCLCYD